MELFPVWITVHTEIFVRLKVVAIWECFHRENMKKVDKISNYKIFTNDDSGIQKNAA